jgi:uncharacterized protein YndB with AHSA1/START domain
MWRRVTVDATIDQPTERVFAYLADPARWHEFVPAVVLRRPLDGGPVVVGSTYTAIDRIGPFSVHFTDELAELEAGRRVVWASSAPWNARTEYVCEPWGGGTRVRARYEGDIGGWLRLFAWIPGPVIARILARDFARLGALLATQASRPQR